MSDYEVSQEYGGLKITVKAPNASEAALLFEAVTGEPRERLDDQPAFRALEEKINREFGKRQGGVL